VSAGRADVSRRIQASIVERCTPRGDGLVAQCGTALLLRRIWAIPAVVLGWVIVAGVTASWVRSTPPAEESSRFWELSGN
jgi:hypothetical protein